MEPLAVMYVALAADGLLALAVVVSLSLAAPLLGPRRRLKGDMGMPYETGEPPLGAPLGRLAVSYVRFALLFAAFDAGLALLLPWVLLRGGLGPQAMASMSVLVGILALALAYVRRKGGLRCFD